MNIFRELALVGLGGMLGAMTRYGIGMGSVKWLSDAFPYGTLIANVTGCFLIGLLIGSGLGESTPKYRLLLGVGFLGSLTTFSTFSAETLQHFNDGNSWVATTNMLGNLVFGFAAAAIGLAIGKKLFGP